MANELTVAYESGTGANAYVILRRLSDLHPWNGTTVEAWNDANLATYAIALTDLGGDVWAANVPAALPAGDWLAKYYERAGGAPATTDLELKTDPFRWNGSTVTVVPPGGAVGVYATEQDIEDLVGIKALDILSDLSGGETRDSANIQRALDWADAYLDSRLSALGYETPLAGTNAETDRIMADLAARLAVWRMNEQRAIQTLTGTNRSAPDIDDLMNGHKKYVDDYLTALGEGDASLVATMTGVATTSAGSFGFSEAAYVRTTAAADENAGLL